MMNIYGEQGSIDEVAGVLTGLRECGLRPDLCSYNTLIKAYGIAGTVEDAVCLVKEMRQNGIEPDEITYTNLITALQQNDKYLEASERAWAWILLDVSDVLQPKSQDSEQLGETGSLPN
ncbi:hypothetical protein NC651_034687 [Populus alba x Populus x berolinensis]|nr:hypothetical protein NC651_034687 [Populus alba x Populus x berolinensis]